jgi:hypothetical protein
MKKRNLLLSGCLALTLSLSYFATPLASHAATDSSQVTTVPTDSPDPTGPTTITPPDTTDTPSDKTVSETTDVVNYDDTGAITNETTTVTDDTTNTTKTSTCTGVSCFRDPIYIPDPGAMNYQFLYSFNTDSFACDKLSELIEQYAAAIIPGGFFKSIWAAGVGTAIWNTYWTPPSTRYFHNQIYQTKDAYYYYGRNVTYEYSDSAQKHLLSKTEYIS